jgi:hypothetical protein
MHFSSRAFKAVFSTIVIAIVLSTAAFGQGELTAVDRSDLVGVAVAKGALRLNEGHVPPEVDTALDQVVAAGKGKFTRGDTEVLAWTGSDLKKLGQNAIVSRFTGAASAGGWQYEATGTENGITFFTLLKDGAQKRAVFGFYGETDGTFVVALTELLAVGDAQPQAKTQGQTQIKSGAAGGSVADYIVPTPSGWTRNETVNSITLASGESSITFLPPVESSGDLESAAERILWQVFKGYEPWAQNGFQPDYGLFERGKTQQGLEYYSMYRYLKKVGDDDPFGGSRFDAVILLVKLGNKIAVAIGRQPFQSPAYGAETATHAIDLLLYDLRFKSVTAPYDLKRDLIGSWSTASSTVALAYTFNPNGTFNKGGAISFRTSHDATHDKVTTTSYGLTDTYSLAGNILTQNYKRTRENSKYKIRFYETKYDKDPWRQRLGFLAVDDTRGDTIVFDRSK